MYLYNNELGVLQEAVNDIAIRAEVSKNKAKKMIFHAMEDDAFKDYVMNVCSVEGFIIEKSEEVLMAEADLAAD